MTGRNELCPCGSGLKYKKCCLSQTEKFTIHDMYFPPNFSDNSMDLGTVKKIPSYKEYEGINCDEIIHAKYNEIIGDSELSEYLNLNFQQTRRFLQIIKTVCKHDQRIFDLRIIDGEKYKQLCCDINKNKYASCIYWNEIDQYIHLYKIEVFNLISERVTKIARYFSDITTAACIARQVIEITTYSIANQWVLTTCFNMLRSNLIKQNDESLVAWKGLEDFVMSLVMLPKKFVNSLIGELPKSIKVNLENGYKVPAYDPTSYQQIEICKFVVSNIFDVGFKSDDDIALSAEMITKCYKVLCKFAHPTPMLFNFGYQSVNINKSEKENYVKSEVLKSLYHSLLLYLNLSESSIFYEMSFLKLIIDKYNTYKNKSSNTLFIESDIIENVMNKYKDIVVGPNDSVVVRKTKPY